MPAPAVVLCRFLSIVPFSTGSSGRGNVLFVYLSPLFLLVVVTSHKDNLSWGTTLRGNGLRLGRFQEILVKMSALGQWSSPGKKVVAAPSGLVLKWSKVWMWHLETRLRSKCWAWRVFPKWTILWFSKKNEAEGEGNLLPLPRHTVTTEFTPQIK